MPIKALRDPFPSPQAVIDLFNNEGVCFANLTKDLGLGDRQIVYSIKSVSPPKRCLLPGDDDPCRTILVRCRVEVPVTTMQGPDLPMPPTEAHKDWNGPTDPCDSDLSIRAFGSGLIVIDPLVLLFKYAGLPRLLRPEKKAPCPPIDPANKQQMRLASSWRLRGIHSGEFEWTGYLTDVASRRPVLAGNGRPIIAATVSGRMGGTNSTGTYRSPTLGGNHVDPERCSESCNAAVLQGRLLGKVDKFATGVPELRKLRGAHVNCVYRLSYDPGAARLKRLDCRMGTVGRGVLGGVLSLKCK